MDSKSVISVEQFCKHYEVPTSFIRSLYNYGLIEIINVEKIQCVTTSQIRTIEKMIRLHYDLDINIEGIDAIHHLLKQNEALRNEITRLHNKLKFYED